MFSVKQFCKRSLRVDRFFRPSSNCGLLIFFGIKRLKMSDTELFGYQRKCRAYKIAEVKKKSGDVSRFRLRGI